LGLRLRLYQVRTWKLAHERESWKTGLVWVAGVDEVGRGALAGPVVAAAVVFDQNHTPFSDITDSKKISPRKRESLAEQIKQSCRAWAVGQSSAEYINKHGIVPATQMAMAQALSNLPTVQHCLIDGRPFKNWIPPVHFPNKTFIVKGDLKCYSIAAASIIAKVFRDTLMKELASTHPDYGWERNVGYGTKEHRQAISQFSLSELHRVRFCRNI